MRTYEKEAIIYKLVIALYALLIWGYDPLGNWLYIIFCGIFTVMFIVHLAGAILESRGGTKTCHPKTAYLRKQNGEDR